MTIESQVFYIYFIYSGVDFVHCSLVDLRQLHGHERLSVVSVYAASVVAVLIVAILISSAVL